MTNAVKLGGINIIRETENAILVNYQGNQQWIPLSQVEKIEKRSEPNKSAIYASEWILTQKGFV